MIDELMTSTSVSHNSNHLLEILPEFLPDLAAVNVGDTDVVCPFEDGRTLSLPLQWLTNSVRRHPLSGKILSSMLISSSGTNWTKL
jgi:hypothetical protein